MPKLIKDHAIIDDTYTLVSPGEDGSLILPKGNVLVTLATWQAHRDVLLAHPSLKGVQLAASEFAETIVSDLPHLDLIAVEFPAFVDGRGYSTAYTLRTRYGYTGELRAVGDVIKDTLFYQQRSGFNAFAVRTDKNIDDALQALTTFSNPYQASASNPLPLYRQRHAEPA
jgi:uncharacterized protein (DUF934 family)